MSRDLNDTLVFVKVVEHGSFVAAARALGLPKTTVSRKVQELEARLGAQLLHRTTRKVGLTEAGTVYFDHCQRIARELDEAESAVSHLQGAPRGWLRVTAPYVLGVPWIAPLLGEFHALHPELRVDMTLTNEAVALIGSEIDVALCIGNLPDSNLIVRRVASFGTGIYASPAYIERHGEPLHPDDLQHHRTLTCSNYRRNDTCFWPLSEGERVVEYRVHPLMVANDPSLLTDALIGGEGLMLSSELTIRNALEKGLVRQVLTGWSGPRLDVSAVFARGCLQSPKVRAFVDFLIQRLASDASVAQAPRMDTQPVELGLA